MRHLKGAEGIVEDRLLIFDGEAGEFREFRLRRDPDCPDCGNLYAPGE